MSGWWISQPFIEQAEYTAYIATNMSLFSYWYSTSVQLLMRVLSAIVLMVLRPWRKLSTFIQMKPSLKFWFTRMHTQSIRISSYCRSIETTCSKQAIYRSKLLFSMLLTHGLDYSGEEFHMFLASWNHLLRTDLPPVERSWMLRCVSPINQKHQYRGVHLYNDINKIA